MRLFRGLSIGFSIVVVNEEEDQLIETIRLTYQFRQINRLPWSLKTNND